MTPSSELSSTLPPPVPIPVPQESNRQTTEMLHGGWTGPALLFLVATLAFLLASFPARNSDIWLHLARGRLLAHGQFPATAAPDLAFERWGNQTWLFDLSCYGCYRILDGAGLVFVKALLAAGLALLVLRLSRSTPGWGIAAFCTSLALLTMSLYLLLQPAIVSLVLLALLLACLGMSGTVKDTARPPLFPWPLLLLFAAWANLDRWFVVGLGVVALTWLGESVEEAWRSGVSQRQRRANLLRRGFALAALTTACLLNPSHRHAFMLVGDWQHFTAPTGPVTSAFSRAYFARAGWNPASLAYFFLLGLSLLSFAVNLPHLPWRRFLPWIGLALASVFQVRVIPFFAIAAGPVLAWNVQDFLARRFAGTAGEAQRAWARRLGQGLAVLLVVVLLVCAWPGWLHAPPFGPRRWDFDLPLSLERGAAAVHRWHQEGKLAADSGGLHLRPETVHAFAWFCPAEKRLSLTAQDSSADGRRRMRAVHANHVIVYDMDRDRLSAALSGLLADPAQWPLLYEEGDLAIFGWRDPAQSGSAELFRDWELDLNQLAFRPADEKKAPSEGPDPRGLGRRWWEAFWKPAPPHAMDRQDALLRLLHAEALQRLTPIRHLSCWENSQAAGLVAAAVGGTVPDGLCNASFRLKLFRPDISDDAPAPRPLPLDQAVLLLQKRFTWQRDDAPPALYYLAVRAARRAVSVNPEDAVAHLFLGESYLGLLHSTRERAWSRRMPKLRQLRHVQASSALNRAILLDPDFGQAHFLLTRLYQEMGYLDLALEHLRTYHRLIQEAGPPRGVRREDFNARQTQTRKEVEQLAKEVQKREDFYTQGSVDSSTRHRAFLAFRNGLAGKALSLLLESHLSAFGNEGMELELELLLGVGRAGDVQEWLRPEHESQLQPPAYQWFLTRAQAATGNYSRAQEECGEAVRSLARRPDSPEPMRLREDMALLTARLLLDGPLSPVASFANLRSQLDQPMLAMQLQALTQRVKQQAELRVLRGMLALEEGEVDEAEFTFRAALDVWKDETTAASGGGLAFVGRDIAQTCLRWLNAER